MNNPFDNAQKQLDKIADTVNVPEDVLARLREPDRVIEVSMPVKMDDGKVKVFRGFRSQFNNARGPYKGGIRFHPGVTKAEVKALSMWMTWKTSILDLPLGGGKGGVIVDPHELSEGELERLSRGYIRAIWRDIGPEVDVPAPDVYTTPQIMAWMADEYSKLVGKQTPGVITGKPIDAGGSLGRDVATAKGGYYVLEALIAKLSKKPEEITVAVQGFGNAGGQMAEFVSTAGMKLVAVSDSKGGIYSADGLDISAVTEHKRKTKSVKDLAGADNITNEQLLELDVDVLIPAALENQITADNADNIKAKVVLELANGPVTPEADEILTAKDVIVVPDILANAGGVTVSYFEMVQNSKDEKWTEDDVLGKLREKMAKAFVSVWDERERSKTTMRQAAYLVAVKRVADAM